MKAHELRIGNWALGNAPFQIKASDIPLAFNYERLTGEERYEGVRLTPEHYKSFNGVLDKEHAWHIPLGSGTERLAVADDGSIALYENEKTYEDGDYFCSNKRIHYLHELQNLIADFTE